MPNDQLSDLGLAFGLLLSFVGLGGLELVDLNRLIAHFLCGGIGKALVVGHAGIGRAIMLGAACADNQCQENHADKRGSLAPSGRNGIGGTTSVTN